ncbi:MAG TPA: GNAT family N-acetyltransferase [Anaerolineae bacterium]|nr:GNAT family N-acetyltransferase [Anaerolineae bacterium]
MSITLVPLEEKHLEDAAALVSVRSRAQRQQTPLLPPRFEDTDTILPWLRDLAGQVPGVAALQGGRLAGFLLAMVIPEFRGKRSTFSPEWANAADTEDSRRIYEEMYTHLSTQWVADGCHVHLVCMLSQDRPGLDAWRWLGFGLSAADGIRDLSPAPGPPVDVEIRRAETKDAGQAVTLLEALRHHLMAAPTFLFRNEPMKVPQMRKWLANPANALWLAYQGSQAVACLGQGSANPDASVIVDDEGTTSIVSAFTREDTRGEGIATALLNRALDWGRAEGYRRCAVDWEPMNVLANRFWLRHFQPVSYALARHIDERVA